jgi:uncharacterized protein (TIGR02231 family)
MIRVTMPHRHPAHRIPWLRRIPALHRSLVLASAAWVAAAAVAAQAPVSPPEPQVSRITRVTLHPGAAVVERAAKVPAGARELLLSCLPEGFDPASLRLEADAPIALGPVTLISLPRAQAPECQRSELDARIRSLEDRLAAVQAEALGHELVLGHLRAGAGKGGAAAEGADGGGGVAKLPAPQLAATLAAVQRLGQEAAQQQHRLGRERERLERELAPLRAERDRLRESAGSVRRLSVQLQAAREGELRLRYLQTGPTWGPTYRAELDTDAGRVRIERLAQITQSTGEDWRGVALRLSTGSPQSAVAGPSPRPWRWVIEEPQPRAVVAAELRTRSLAAPAPAAALAADGGAPPPPPFQVQAVQGDFTTEFVVPGQVDVASSGQLVSLTLETQVLPARWLVQAVPAAQPSAWLLAELARPAGVWPEGPLQLLRERQVVGNATWPGPSTGGSAAAAPETLTLPFGRDELVRVQLLPAERKEGSAGFVAQRAERQIARAYRVENAHRQSVTLRLLEPLPTAVDERITIERRLVPEPTHPRWQGQPGVAAWEVTLPAGQAQRFSADYSISWPKDLPVRER